MVNRNSYEYIQLVWRRTNANSNANLACRAPQLWAIALHIGFTGWRLALF